MLRPLPNQSDNMSLMLYQGISCLTPSYGKYYNLVIRDERKYNIDR